MHFGCGGGCAGLARASRQALELMLEVVEEGMRKGTEPRRLAREPMRIVDPRSSQAVFVFGGMSLLKAHGGMRYLERR